MHNAGGWFRTKQQQLANHMFDMAVPFGHLCLDMKSLFPLSRRRVEYARTRKKGGFLSLINNQ
jgi:hypothetical protein